MNRFGGGIAPKGQAPRVQICERGKAGWVGIAWITIKASRLLNNVPTMSLGQPNLSTQLTAWLMRRTAHSGVRRVAPIAAALATDVGEVRAENQDRVVIARGRDGHGRPFAIAALADGIGGMRQGAECAAWALGGLISAVASESLVSIDPGQWLLRGIRQANHDVYSRLNGEGGTTLAAVLLSANAQIHWASVGDSRVYHSDLSGIKQLSIDDTIAGQLGRGGEAGFEQSRLIQFVGIGAPLEIVVSDLTGYSDGAIFLTSDGVHFLDSTPWFSQLIRSAPDPGVCVRRLVELSKWCGGPDNASAVTVALGPALSDNMPPADGCLEVWDPFGELQVIFELPKATSAPSSPVAPVAQKMAPAPAVKVPDAEVPTTLDLKRETKAVPATKKSRAPRKGKAVKVQKGQKGEEKTEQSGDVPQLLIEFPNKTV